MNPSIAFIGAGNMAEALIRGLRSAQAGAIVAADVRQERLEQLRAHYGIEICADNARAASNADVVVVAVKPQQMSEALGSLRSAIAHRPLLISIAAGITTARIERELIGEPRVVRAMPNTPALVGAGVAAVCRGRFATEADLAVAEGILRAVGLVVRVEEREMDAVTALSGSGPAYIFYMTEALIAAGVEAGLSEEVAKQLATQTVFGAAELLVESGRAPAELRGKVTSPGGTTEAALKVMQERGFEKIVAEAVRAAARRSRELSGDIE